MTYNLSMSIRPLDIRDLPNLYRFRSEVISLDSTRTLTRGNPLGAMGLLAYVNPARHLYSAAADGDKLSLLGGVIHTKNEPFAKLLYLAPSVNLGHSELPALIENLSAEAGKWGAFHVLAEVDELNEAFSSLRTAGFSVYAWQRMWNVSNLTAAGQKSGWRRVKSDDIISIQNLYHQIVPPLLQPIEPALVRVNGFICNEGLKCYASTSYGAYGIVLNPLIHPDAIDVGQKLSAMLDELPDRHNRPVYLCVRSYQAWLEPVLEDLGAKATERQAVMVKHLTRLVKNGQSVLAKQPNGVTVQPTHIHQAENKANKS